MQPHTIERWPGRVFLLVAALSLLPVWSVSHLPTVDGPAHLYNAWIIAHLGDAAGHPLFRATFEVNPAPVPNWLSSAALLVLLRVLAPVIAEKTLASLYLALFFWSLWYAAGAVCRDRRWLAFLGFPFAYSLFFELGFYNFCFSLALYMLAIGLWWRRRALPNPQTALVLNGVVLLCYFCHIVSVILALLSIAALWLGTLRRDNWRRHGLHVPILAPQLALPLWFLLRGGLRSQPSLSTFRDTLAGLVRLDSVSAFQPTRGWLGAALAAAFGLLLARSAAVRLRDREPAARHAALREEDAFLLLPLLLVAVYCFAPEGLAGGSNLKSRLALYPFLALLPWLSPRLAATPRATVIGLLTALALVNLGVTWSCYRTLDQRVSDYLRALDPVVPDSHVLPLSWDHDGDCARAGIFTHMLDYAAVEKGLVDWNNYQAMTDYFPVRFKAGIDYPPNFLMEWAPDRLPVEEYRRSTEYVLTWRMPVNGQAHRRILRYYDELPGSGPLRLFQRRAAAADGTKRQISTCASW
jgi:hypothetical protein